MGAEPAERSAALVPDIGSGRYRLGPEIGRGGKARVFLARDHLLRRDVAVKVFSIRAADVEDLRVQEAEAMLGASLNHFALTTLYDAGIDTSDAQHPRIFLIMEYVAGGDLRQLLRKGALSSLQTAYLGFDLVQGLDYLHGSGFLHGDIKPANVLLRGPEERLRGKLADFGISTAIGAGAPQLESVTGTAAYLSPEQADGEEAGPESDVYSLGLVLLEAMTGRVAFPGDVETSALARLDRDPDVPIGLPSSLGGLLRRMTDRRRGERPSSREVMDEFQDYVVDAIVRRRRGSAPRLPVPNRPASGAAARTDLVDLPADDGFHDVTELLTRTLHLPVAIVGVIEGHRARFASQRGVRQRDTQRSTTRAFERSGAHDTWLTGTRVVAETLDLALLRDHPLVAGPPFLRSMIAVPLIAHDGEHIGRVVVGDVVPRRFDDDEVATVEVVSRIVMRELELRRAVRRALLTD